MASAQGELLKSDYLEGENGSKRKLTRSDIIDSKYAWIACTCAVIDQVFVCGFLQIFGVFFVEFVRDFNSTQSEAAWLGSLAYGIMKLFGPVTGFVVVRFSNRVSMLTGCLVCASSLLISSYMESMAILYLSYSVLYGIGSSLVINCAMVLSNEYFDKQIGWATGFVCAGSSIGTLILAPTAQLMIEHVGWRTAFKVLMAVFIVVALLNILIRPIPKDSELVEKEGDYSKIPPNRENEEIKEKIDKVQKPTSLRGLLENRAFVLWSLATTLAMFGYYIPFVHLVAYGVDVGIPAAQASYFIMTLGASTTVGRLVSGRVVQSGYLNCLHLNQLCLVLTGSMYMLLPLARSFAGIMTFVVLLGLSDGCYVVLLPTLTCALVGVNNAVIAWGMLVCAGSVTFSIGPPVAGALYDYFGNYNLAFHVAGIPVICGALVLFFIPWAQKTSRVSTALNYIASQENVDSGNASEEYTFQDISRDSSEDTLHFNVLKSGGYILPTTRVVSNIDGYLDTHFQTNVNVMMSNSLGDHREQPSGLHDLQSESLPVPLQLVCGPDGMPISVPSRMTSNNIRASHSTVTGQSISSSNRSRSLRPSNQSNEVRTVDVSTQFTEQKSVANTTGGPCKIAQDIDKDESKICDDRFNVLDITSDEAPSEWSMKNNVGTSMEQKEYRGADSTTVRDESGLPRCSSGNFEYHKTDTRNQLADTVSSVSALTRDTEEIDVFKHIFKQDTSETSF